jgi:hypothetical protein
MRILATLLLATVAAARPDEALRVGLVVTAAGHSVLAMAGPALVPGAVVTLVTIDSSQQVQRALITSRVAESETMAKHATQGPYYKVSPQSSSSALPDFAVAVLGDPDVRRMGAAVGLRVGNPAITVRVRACASSEGLHLTLWDGEPLKGRRLWHAYYYLGYDVEPTCQPADYRDGG